MPRYMPMIFGAALALAAGCGPAAPTLSGGKPASHWVQALADADPKKREQAAEKLGNVGSADPAAYPALTGALKDPSPRVRGAAILGLAKSGTAAKGVVSTLEGLKDHDPDPGVRDYAARAIKTINHGG